MTQRPNFFIVGAPKCGTTSMYEGLRRHPQVYMPYDAKRYWLAKEPGYFCSELIARPYLAVSDEAAYLQLFAAAAGAQRIGEASALYLFSQYAAERIGRFEPRAKIIIMIREPVAMMRSWHADNLRHGHENVASFEQAIELQESRRQGNHLPPGAGYPACLQYQAMATFSEQIERYWAVFGRQQVRVVLLEDLATRPQATMNDVCAFLELAPDCLADPFIANERVALSQGMLLKQRVKNWLRRFAIVQRARKNVPVDFDAWLEWGLKPWMKNVVVEQPLDTQFIDRLQQQMSAEIDRLGSLLGRDLTHWSRSVKSDSERNGLSAPPNSDRGPDRPLTS